MAAFDPRRGSAHVSRAGLVSEGLRLSFPSSEMLASGGVEQPSTVAVSAGHGSRGEREECSAPRLRATVDPRRGRAMGSWVEESLSEVRGYRCPRGRRRLVSDRRTAWSVGVVVGGVVVVAGRWSGDGRGVW